MKNTSNTTIYSSLALTAMIGSASAVTALIDFGLGSAAAASPYNSAAIIATGPTATTGAIALSDTDSAATGWTVTVLNTGSGNGGNAGGGANVAAFPAGLAGFDNDALRNSIYANQGGGTNPAMTLTFSGLTSTSTYDLLLYGSRANAQGANQRWSLTQGSGGADVDHFSENNSTTFVDWSGVSPDAGGIIQVTINSPGPDSIGALALNFGSLTENAVPEPSGMSLLGLGLGALFLRRKRA